MPRKRRNDPLGVSDTPVTVNDTAREGELIKEYQAWLSYIAESYWFAKKHLGDRDFNISLARLKRAVNRNRPLRQQSICLHPELGILVNHHAQEFARERGEVTKVEQHDVERAAAYVAQSVKPRQGRPRDRMVRQKDSWPSSRKCRAGQSGPTGTKTVNMIHILSIRSVR